MSENFNFKKRECPIAIIWSIPEKDLKEMKPGEFIESEIFFTSNFYEIEYHLEINKNDDEDDIEERISVDVHFQCYDIVKFKCDINFSIPSANILLNANRVFENSGGVGKCFCKPDELFDPKKGFIVDGKMLVKMDGILTVEEDEVIAEKLQPFDNPADTLCLGLWNQEDGKNFSIIVDGKEITAHKNVLAIRSPVFARMFQTKMKEAEESKVEIKDFPFEIVEMGIKFCYHESLVSTASLEDKLRLLQFFDKYDVQQLKDDLVKYLISVINEITVCRLTNASLLSNATKLKESCAKFLRRCIKTTKPISDFDLLDKDFAMDLLKNAFYHVSH